ncbi:MAG: putative lipid II flippase FtsW [Candidatus Babeliales bacterium]
MIQSQKKLQADLHIFLSSIAALIVIGLLFIYSSSSVFAFERLGSSFYFVKKQLIGLSLGLIGLLLFRIVPLELIKNASPYLFLSSLVATMLTFVPGLSLRIHGSNRWLSLPGLSFQPSELLRIFLIIYLAYFLSKKEGKLGSFFSGFFPFLIIVGAPCLILLAQPDFGMAVTIASTSFMLFFVIHFSSYLFFGTLGIAIPVILLLIFKYPYRLKRIAIFLNPWNDPQGAGFQIIQSLIAIGSGSFWGTGVSHSKQKFFYLPMQHTDFIFSIIAEETGFIGATLLIALYVVFLYVGMRIAWQLKDLFSVLVVLGFVILTSLQAVINLAVTTGLAPTKGIGLPFVSYGNSALICGLCMVGLVMNCVADNRRF